LDAIERLLSENPVALIFVILGLGYLIGKTRIRGFEFGSVTGVLIAGLFFGHLGYQFQPAVQTFGFVMFIFSVGFQAGPSFFAVLRRDVAKYFLLAMVVASTGFGCSAWFANLFDFPSGISAGLLAGSMTTTPTLAAAQDALQSGAVALSNGLTVADAVGNLTTAYAITYLFGLVGLILIIRILPGLLGIDLASEAEKVGDRKTPPDPGERISVRSFRVEFNELVGIPHRELKERFPDSASLVRLKRGGEFIDIDDETALEIGDEMTIMAKQVRFIETPRIVGTEIANPVFSDLEPESVRIVVTRRDAVGLTLGELGVTDNYGCFITAASRLQVKLPMEASLELQRGDVLTVTGPSFSLGRLGERLGHLEREHVETDLLTLAVGIALGIAIGTWSVVIGGISIGLGTAGGLLTMGLLIGYLRSLHPTFGRIPSAARWVFMELGLQMFMAGVGVAAGSGILKTLISSGPNLVLCGIVVTAAPVAAGWIVGRYLLRLNPALLLGGITGAMTSGAALSTVNAAAKSTIPALGYTGAYAFSNIILTVAGTLIVRF